MHSRCLALAVEQSQLEEHNVHTQTHVHTHTHHTQTKKQNIDTGNLIPSLLTRCAPLSIATIRRLGTRLRYRLKSVNHAQKHPEAFLIMQNVCSYSKLQIHMYIQVNI